MLNAKRGMLIAACAGTLLAAAFGCGPSIPDKIGFAGQNATLQSSELISGCLQRIRNRQRMRRIGLWDWSGRERGKKMFSRQRRTSPDCRILTVDGHN